MEQAATAQAMILEMPAAFRVACWNANRMRECKGHFLMDTLDMEVQGTKADVIEITECGALLTSGCVGLYSMANL